MVVLVSNDAVKTLRSLNWVRLLLFMVLCVGAGCNRGITLNGTVLDAQGQTLPGVTATVRGTELQTLTNGLGQYTLHCPPGALTIEFIKTGYTSAVLDLALPAEGTARADNVQLRRLPLSQGVYLLQDDRYFEMTRAEPRQFRPVQAKDSTNSLLSTPSPRPQFAVGKLPELQFRSHEAIILCYKLPAFDVYIHRLETLQGIPYEQSQAAADPAPAAHTLAVWAPRDKIAIVARPVDEPEQLLVELRLLVPLDPGVYAIHWGALDGHPQPPDVGPWVYLFQIIPDDTDEDKPAEIQSDSEESEANPKSTPPEAMQELNQL
jgi:hypothetical protein